MAQTEDIIPYSEVSSIGFYILGSEDHRVNGHVEVTEPDNLRKGNIPVDNGIYDAHMGTTRRDVICKTCQQNKELCPGHFGYLKLNYPVQSPLFMKDIMRWLKVACYNCGKLIAHYGGMKFRADKILNQFVKTVRSSNKILQCVHCQSVQPHIVKDKEDNFTIFRDWYDLASATSSSKGKLQKRERIMAHEIARIFDKISNETVAAMGKPIECHPRKLILDYIPVPPNTIRPNVEGSSRSGNDDLTVLLRHIVEANRRLPATIPDEISDEMLMNINNISLEVYEMVKGTSASPGKRKITTGANNKQLTSVAKRLPRKFGRIRRNLMGRRSNHMARSFITCDPSLKLDEVGVPRTIAQGIQRPIVVRNYNYEQCMFYVMNAARNAYPKASRVYRADTGDVHWLDRHREDQPIKVGDVIYRDIIDGDIVNFNRQPSLEPSSISSLKVVIMEQGQTIRMNVLICPAFNADFDGDAMNVLFTRSTRTTNEIQHLSGIAQRFVSYKNARPIFGEAQDSLIGTAEFTRSETKIDKAHAMQVIAQADIIHDFSQYPDDHVFTGRDLITIYLKESNNEINFTGRPAIYNPMHEKFRTYNEDDIKIEIDRGELKSGILDKASVGEGANGGIFHIIHNQYGPDAALEACYAVQQMALSYLFNRGVTVSLADIMLKDRTLAKIHTIEKGLIADSMKITERLKQGNIIPPLGKTITEYYEEQQINALDAGDEYWPHILSDIDTHHNNLYKLIAYGSKGKLFNFKNVSAAIGQIEINGERIPENFGGRTAPYFTRHDPRPGARGYIANGYRTGITPTEFIFHAMENRYQLINKALSTSITGMKNREAIKNLESLIVDNQRKLTKQPGVVQLLYGGDGVDPRFLEKVKFPTMDKSFSDSRFKETFHTQASAKDKKLQRLFDEEYAQLITDRDFYRNIMMRIEIASGQVYSDALPMPVNIRRIIEDTVYNLQLRENSTGSLDLQSALEKVKTLCETITYALLNEVQEQKRAPIPPHLRDSTRLLQILIRSYLNTSALRRLGITDEALDIILYNIKLTYSRSLISYGMAMGIIAAQSISEPMTQMVLDSHHNSGAASTKKKGMFRIQEIAGAKPTDKMKAPSMTIHVKEEYETNKTKVQEIAHHIEMMKLQDFINSSKIFFEKYGEPVHPEFKQEKSMIREFEKYNLGVSAPKDLANWCIRLSLDKYKLIEKQMKMETIYYEIIKKFPDVHIVYTSDNAENIIVRIYMRSVMIRRPVITSDYIREIADNIQNTVIRGVPGIRAAFVKDGTKTVKAPDGSLEERAYHYIFTDGTNLEAILENPYIDPYTVQSDSIIEMYNIFGIGSSREKIIYEFRDQVGEPSYRHFTVYADEMTVSGRVTSIDRYGTAKRDASIMLRISDASPISVIEESAINGVSDYLKGVSPPLMLGKNPRVGDLYNTFKWDEEFVDSQIKSTADILDEL